MLDTAAPVLNPPVDMAGAGRGGGGGRGVGGGAAYYPDQGQNCHNGGPGHDQPRQLREGRGGTHHTGQRKSAQ
ncbi:MAG: hypothetical protein K0M73_05620, partial [Hydrogenophaga sp.]|nr:hypothetical protein [Hydrogenophaga sp.]